MSEEIDQLKQKVNAILDNQDSRMARIEAALNAKSMPQSTQPEPPPSNQMIRDAGDFIKLAESIKNMLPKQPTLMEQLEDMVALKGALADLNDTDVADIADTSGNPEDAMLMRLLEKMIPQKEAPLTHPGEKPIYTEPSAPKNTDEIKIKKDFEGIVTNERKAWIDAELNKLPSKAVYIAKAKPKEWVKKRIQDQISLSDAEFEYAYSKMLIKHIA